MTITLFRFLIGFLAIIFIGLSVMFFIGVLCPERGNTVANVSEIK